MIPSSTCGCIVPNHSSAEFMWCVIASSPGICLKQQLVLTRGCVVMKRQCVTYTSLSKFGRWHNENTPLMLFPSSIILMEAVNTASTAVGSFRSRRGPVITSVDPVPAEQVGSSGLGGLDNLANSGQEALSSKIKQNLFFSLSQTILSVSDS